MWWLGSLLSGAALIVLSRWALRVARPQEDIAMTARVIEQAFDGLYEAWTILWRAYGPVTARTRAAWEGLRARYRGGTYGVEGT